MRRTSNGSWHLALWALMQQSGLVPDVITYNELANGRHAMTAFIVV
jgi:hypothetical protein